MQASQLLLIVPSVALLLVAGIVGIRLLWLSHKTGGVPERLMGAGLFILLVIYLPMMAVSGMGRLAVGELKLGLLAFATVLLWGSFTSLVAFTWKAFRPNAAWATMLTMTLSASVAAAGGALIATLMMAPPEASSFEAGKFWTGLIRIPMLINFVWTGAEGMIAYRMARRRLAIGLGDPIVANRFLLWSIVGVVQVVTQGTGYWLHLMGIGLMASPVGLFVAAVGAMAGSVLMVLAFVPPSAYLRFIERRAVAVPA